MLDVVEGRVYWERPTDARILLPFYTDNHLDHERGDSSIALGGIQKSEDRSRS